MRGVRICSVRTKLFFELPFCWAHNKEAQRIEHFVGQWISELFDASACHADRKLIGGYGRLGVAEGPTNIFPKPPRKTDIVAAQIDKNRENRENRESLRLLDVNLGTSLRTTSET